MDLKCKLKIKQPHCTFIAIACQLLPFPIFIVFFQLIVLLPPTPPDTMTFNVTVYL